MGHTDWCSADYLSRSSVNTRRGSYMDPQSSPCLTFLCSTISVNSSHFCLLRLSASPLKELTGFYLSFSTHSQQQPGNGRNQLALFLPGTVVLGCLRPLSCLLYLSIHSLLVSGRRVNLVPATTHWPREEVPSPKTCHVFPPPLSDVFSYNLHAVKLTLKCAG